MPWRKVLIKAVINADDFGKNESINKAIAECFAKGFINNTTLMVNMDVAPMAVDLANKEGFADKVGIHFNLTSGYPLTDGIKHSRLFCDEDGKFNAAFYYNTLKRLVISREETNLVYAEAKAQVERYLDFGLSEKHLDSHHHVHTNLSIWRPLNRVLKEYNFHTVRLGRNMYEKASIYNDIYKKFLNSSINRNGYGFADLFGSFEDLKEYYNHINKDIKIEIMTHPMYSESGELMDTETPMSELVDYINKKEIILEAISK